MKGLQHLFDAHPGKDAFYITSDGIAHETEHMANVCAEKLADKNVATVTREGVKAAIDKADAIAAGNTEAIQQPTEEEMMEAQGLLGKGAVAEIKNELSKAVEDHVVKILTAALNDAASVEEATQAAGPEQTPTATKAELPASKKTATSKNTGEPKTKAPKKS